MADHGERYDRSRTDNAHKKLRAFAVQVAGEIIEKRPPEPVVVPMTKAIDRKSWKFWEKVTTTHVVDDSWILFRGWKLWSKCVYRARRGDGDILEVEVAALYLREDGALRWVHLNTKEYLIPDGWTYSKINDDHVATMEDLTALDLKLRRVNFRKSTYWEIPLYDPSLAHSSFWGAGVRRELGKLRR